MRKPGKHFWMGPLAACGLLAASALAGPAAQPAAAPPGPQVNQPGAREDAYPGSLGLPLMPGARHVPMDGKLSTGEVPLDAQIFFTELDVAAVMDFYRADLTERGLRVSEHKFSPFSGYVGFYHTATQTMRLATIQARPAGGSMIVLSAMNPAPLLGRRMQIPEDLPNLPGAINVATTQSEQAGASNRTVYFEAWGRPEEVTALLAASAGDKGWRQAPEDKRASKEGLTLQRDSETCIIRVSAAHHSTAETPSSAITMVVIGETSNPGRKKQ